MWLIPLSLLLLVDAYISRQETCKTKAFAAAGGLIFQPIAAWVFISTNEMQALILCFGYSFFWADEVHNYWLKVKTL